MRLVPSGFAFSEITKREARTVATWEYEPPYDVYNYAPAERAEVVRSFVDRRRGYHSARLDGELVGFCCFGRDAQVSGGDYAREDLLDVGLGMRPDLTGRGLGLSFVQALLAFADETRAPAGYRMTVAGFNKRAIRVYERAGLRIERTFELNGRPWMQLVLVPRAAGALPA